MLLRDLYCFKMANNIFENMTDVTFRIIHYIIISTEENVSKYDTWTVAPKGAHTHTSLARESDSARVPMSQTRPCVGRKVGSQLMRLW
jgi:hypothetical protein